MFDSDSARLLLPEGATLLHLGPTKTGSTALQNALFARRDQLQEHGAAYPGGQVKPEEAISGLIGWKTHWNLHEPDPAVVAAFQEELAATAGLRTCISYERLGRADAGEAARAVAALGGERPHVVVVARRYDRYFPSEWQQDVKQFETLDYDAWLRRVLGEGGSADAQYRRDFVWRGHDTVGLVHRWAPLVGIENVTVIVADEANRAALPTAFESLLGLPHGLLSSYEGVANRSLSYDEIELLRRWNISYREVEESLDDRIRFVRRAGRVLAELEPVAQPVRFPALPDWAHADISQRADERNHDLSGLQADGLRIVGNLDALRLPPLEPDRGVAVPMTEFTEQSVERLLSAIATAARNDYRARSARVERMTQRIQRLERRLAEAGQSASQSRALVGRVKRRLTGR